VLSGIEEGIAVSFLENLLLFEERVPLLWWTIYCHCFLEKSMLLFLEERAAIFGG
jgi:hypothetical protein